MGGKGRRVCRNNYKGHIQKSNVGVESQEGDGDGWGRGSGGGEMQTTLLEKQHNQKFKRK